MKHLSLQHYFLTAIILAVPVSAISQEFNYDYIQGTYASSTVDTGFGDVDGNGFGFSGSFSISPNLAFMAGFASASFDIFLGVDVNVDTDSTAFGVTAHSSTGAKTDVFGGYSVLMGDIEATDGFTTISDDDTGNIIEFGFRHMASDTVELTAAFARTDIFDDTSNQTGFGLRFYTGESLSIGIGYSTGDDVDTVLFNLRAAI